MADKKNPLGPTGEQVRANVKRLREAQRLTYRELSDRLGTVGRPIPTLGLSRIEAGERRVDADDLVALAVVLGVNVSALLLPSVAYGDIEVTGAGAVDSGIAWQWADGSVPLCSPDDPDYQLKLLDFVRYGRPRGYGGFDDPDTMRQLGEAIRDHGDRLTQRYRDQDGDRG